MDKLAESFQGLINYSAQLFKDWSLFSPSVIAPQLPRNIRYARPKPNESLRTRIRPIEKQLSQLERTLLKSSLFFLEAGILEDDFKRDDKARDKFLLAYTVRLGDKEEALYFFCKKVNKLSGNAISKIITAGQLTNDPLIEKKSLELKEKVEAIKKERGYFLPSDLHEVDVLAIFIIEHILGQHSK